MKIPINMRSFFFDLPSNITHTPSGFAFAPQTPMHEKKCFPATCDSMHNHVQEIDARVEDLTGAVGPTVHVDFPDFRWFSLQVLDQVLLKGADALPKVCRKHIHVRLPVVPVSNHTWALVSALFPAPQDVFCDPDATRFSN